MSLFRFNICQPHICDVGHLRHTHIVPHNDFVIASHRHPLFYKHLLLKELAKPGASPIAIFIAQFNVDGVVLHNLAVCHIIHYQQQVAVRIVIVVAHADCNVVGINPSDAVGLQKHQGAGLGPTLGVYCLEIAVESPSWSTGGGKQ